MCMEISHLERSLAACARLRTDTFVRLASLVLKPSTQTQWDYAVKDARDAQALFDTVEAEYDAKMNELFPE